MHIIYMINFADFFQMLFAADSIWSVVFRGLLWFVVAVVILISLDNPDTDRSMSNLKANLGFLLMFLVLSGGLIYLIFGFDTV